MLCHWTSWELLQGCLPKKKWYLFPAFYDGSRPLEKMGVLGPYSGGKEKKERGEEKKEEGEIPLPLGHSEFSIPCKCSYSWRIKLNGRFFGVRTRLLINWSGGWHMQIRVSPRKDMEKDVFLHEKKIERHSEYLEFPWTCTCFWLIDVISDPLRYVAACETISDSAHFLRFFHIYSSASWNRQEYMQQSRPDLVIKMSIWAKSSNFYYFLYYIMQQLRLVWWRLKLFWESYWWSSMQQ